MALGFRKSLFGYNCEDVAEYITKAATDNKQAVSALKEKLKTEAQQNTELNQRINSLNDDLAKTAESLDFYKAKYEEIKTLSDNIGKLYLVAQTNARAIITAADDASGNSKAELERNISVLDKTEAALLETKEKLNTLNEEFTARVTALSSELESIKRLSSKADSVKQESLKSFENAYKKITE